MHQVGGVCVSYFYYDFALLHGFPFWSFFSTLFVIPVFLNPYAQF